MILVEQHTHQHLNRTLNRLLSGVGPHRPRSSLLAPSAAGGATSTPTSLDTIAPVSTLPALTSAPAPLDTIAPIAALPVSTSTPVAPDTTAPTPTLPLPTSAPAPLDTTTPTTAKRFLRRHPPLPQRKKSKGRPRLPQLIRLPRPLPRWWCKLAAAPSTSGFVHSKPKHMLYME